MNIGIDLGGSHIGIALVEKGNILTKREEDLKNEATERVKEKVVEKICELIKEILQEKNLNMESIEGIGISAPRCS